MENYERFRLLIAVDSWSSDHWDEINHPEPDLRDPDTNPDSVTILLGGMFEKYPGYSEIQERIRQAQFYLNDFCGKKQVKSYSIVGYANWSRIMDATKTREKDIDGKKYPLIEYCRDSGHLDSLSIDMGIMFIKEISEDIKWE